MANERPTLGVIGTGSFGRFAADKMKPYFDVRLVGRSSNEEEFFRAATSDYVVLAIPFNGYDEVLPKLKKLIGAGSVLVDVCSVKTIPIQDIKAEMPNQSLLATHPLFGPESAAKSFAGQTIVICPQPGSEKIEEKATKFFEQIGLKVCMMSEKEHDKLMADLQGLTFFIARALALYGIDDRPIMTPSYHRLLELAELEENHSPELFATIQLANPYAKETSGRFIKIAEKLADSLSMERADG